MSATAARRKVLIVEDDSAIRNILYALVAAERCDGDVASNGRRALAMISRDSFDAVLLDLRCPDVFPGRTVSQIAQLHPNLVGRVLVITGEIAGQTSLEMIARHCLLQIPRNTLASDLWGALRSLLGLSKTPKAAA